MKTAKSIAEIGVFTALLLGAQFIFSFIPSVEVITVLLLTFSFTFGIIKGMTSATLFSLLRCFVFGFYPTVIILHLVYYNLFALFFGFWGKKANGKITKKKFLFTILFAALFTACFSLLDDLITPLFYGFDFTATKAYFIASLPFMIPQVINAVITVSILFIPLYKLLYKIKN